MRSQITGRELMFFSPLLSLLERAEEVCMFLKVSNRILLHL